MLGLQPWKIVVALLVTCLALLFAFPNIISQQTRDSLPTWLSDSTLNLGLDLRGGSYLLLEVDIDAYMKDQMDFLKDSTRKALRKERIGYTNLRATGSDVSFTLRNPAQFDATKEVVKDINRDLEIDKQGKAVIINYPDTVLAEMRVQVLGQSIEIVRRRIDETGTKEPDIQQQGSDRILLQMPGVENPEQIKSILGKTAKLTFHMVDGTVSEKSLAQGVVPLGTKILPLDQGRNADKNARVRRIAVKQQALLSGDMLTNASATYSAGEPVVSFSFNTTGARKFGEITRENVGRPFAVVLDNKVITAPVIQTPILGGNGIITGNFTVGEAEELALLLRAGALPAPLNIIEERSVGPSLGQDSIEAGKISAIISLVAIGVFMLFSYGLFGIFANIALSLNIVLIISCLSLLQATLTLPGIAGIALTMGMAVDANVLIFERIKEELKKGSSVIASIDRGFRNAFATIFDSNITTLIAAFLLLGFGSGPVKGFGVTLSIGLLSSMFSAVLLTRMMIVFWLKAVKPKKLSC